MTHKFASQEATATRLIAKNGAAAVVETPGTIDESTSPPTKIAPTTATFMAVQTKLDQRDLAEANTQVGDIKLLLATGSTEPTPDDKVVWGGKRYSIASVMSVAPAGVPVLWKVIARGGVAV